MATRKMENELLVFGYLRTLQSIINQIIPMDINYLCFTFYFIDGEYFASKRTCSASQWLSISKKYGKKITNYSTYDNTAYGVVLINPLKSHKYIWKFKITEGEVYYSGYNNVYIGINAFPPTPNKLFAPNDKFLTYAYCSNGKKYHNGISEDFTLRTYVHDIVMMKLDFTTDSTKRLSFCVLRSDDSQSVPFWQVAFDDILCNSMYKMAAKLSGYGTVKILQFKDE
eukprot:87764_1